MTFEVATEDRVNERLALSRIALGTMTFGDTVDETTAGRMIEMAVASGITVIDTANVYVGGVTEEMLGRLLKGKTEDLVLATKAGQPHPDHGTHAPLSPEGLRNSVEGSLRRLQVERIDLFYLHMPDRRTPLQTTLTTVAELVAEGKIGSLGVSNYSAWQIGDLIHVAEEVGAPQPVIAQQLYNLLARRVEEEYVEFATAHQVQTVVYNPLAGGLLTGRYTYDSKPVDGRFGDSRISEPYTRRYWDKQLFDAAARLADIARAGGIAPAELALRWLAYRRGVSSVLLGGSKVEQLEANVSAISAGALPQDVVDACDAVGAELRGPMPAYNR